MRKYNKHRWNQFSKAVLSPKDHLVIQIIVGLGIVCFYLLNKEKAWFPTKQKKGFPSLLLSRDLVSLINERNATNKT